MKRSSASARLLLIAAAVLFSTGGAAIKLTTLNAWQVAGMRSLVAAAAILLLIPGARLWRWRYTAVAAAYATTMLFFVAATKLTTAANAIFLQDTAPLFVLLLNPLLLKEPIRRSDLFLMLAVACGMMLFFTGHEAAHATAPDPARGNILAAIAAVTWALTLIGLRWVGRNAPLSESPGMATVAMGNLIACVVAWPMAFPLPVLHAPDLAAVVWLGLFQIGLAYVCLTRGLQSVQAVEATTLLLLEPVLNPVWAWLLHHERPAGQSLAGGGIILGAMLLNAWLRPSEG